jgi:DNA topoisomerase III
MVCCAHPLCGGYVQELAATGIRRPQGGVDMGDHRPITPVATATEASLGGGDEWRVYDFVTRHFLASVSPDCIFKRSKAVLTAAGEQFTASGAPPCSQRVLSCVLHLANT